MLSENGDVIKIDTTGRHTTPATSGLVKQRKSAINRLPVTLRMPRVKSDESDWLLSQSIVFTNPFKTEMPEVAMLGADQKECGLWDENDMAL